MAYVEVTSPEDYSGTIFGLVGSPGSYDFEAHPPPDLGYPATEDFLDEVIVDVNRGRRTGRAGPFEEEDEGSVGPFGWKLVGGSDIRSNPNPAKHLLVGKSRR